MAFHRYLALTAVIGPLALAGVAYADPPCLADIQKFCSKTPSVGEQIQDCLKAHETELSKGCKGHVDQVRKMAQELAAICVWDIERFCSDVSPGGGKIATCLQTNKDDLSPVCKDRFEKVGKD